MTSWEMEIKNQYMVEAHSYTDNLETVVKFIDENNLWETFKSEANDLLEYAAVDFRIPVTMVKYLLRK